MNKTNLNEDSSELIDKDTVLQSASNETDETLDYDSLESSMSAKLEALSAEYEALELEAQRLRS